MRRVGVVLAGLIILIIYSVAILMANDIAQANPLIKRILQVKEVEVEKIKTEYKTIYIDREVEVYWYQFYATGYSPDDPRQGTNRTMASGREVYQGSIAADPEVLPLGTKVYIQGLPDGLDGIYIVEDTGGAIKGLRIDVFRESKFKALQINCPIWIRILED